MAAISGLTSPRFLSTTGNSPTPIIKLPTTRLNHMAWKNISRVKPLSATGPESISDKVAESIKEAEEACAGDPVSGECVAAWDTVEELSAAASHIREKNKNSDPLETYCKDNPETDECRTYDN